MKRFSLRPGGKNNGGGRVSSFKDLILGPGGGANAASGSIVHAGWVFGGGAEWALNLKWSVKAEYLHANAGQQTVPSSYTDTFGNVFNVQHTENVQMNLVRLGVNYKF